MWPVYPVVARVPGSPLTSSVEAAALVVADTYRRFQSRRRPVFSHGERCPSPSVSAICVILTRRILPASPAARAARRRDVRMMGSNSGGGGGGPGGGMGPGMGGPVGGGGDGRHDDEAALTEFLSSLMDYTPTVGCRLPLAFSLLFCLLA